MLCSRAAGRWDGKGKSGRTGRGRRRGTETGDSTYSRNIFWYNTIIQVKYNRFKFHTLW